MKLDADTINYIVEVVRTAKQIGLDGIVIEPGFARGTDTEVTRIMLHTEKVPAMPFGSIAINRIDLFLNRYEIARGTDGFSMEVKTQGEDNTVILHADTPRAMFVHSIQMKAKGLKLDYKCSNPLVVKSPRKVKDRMKYRVQMTPDGVMYMNKGKAAIGTDEIWFKLQEDSAELELVDANNDKLVYQFGNVVHKEIEDDDSEISFSQKYPLEIVKTLFSISPDAQFCVSDTTGYIQMRVNSFNVCILPKVVAKVK